ncbi:MAG: ankyrin repeat domain-containing protein [Leptospiraceae bacterium]|nr:ankyrin repeat domain-containing protein [Leptospiraceae bacterium]
MFHQRSFGFRGFALFVGLLALPSILAARPTGDQVDEAICDRNLVLVQTYVAQGWNINAPLSPDSGNTALTLASYCYGGAVDIASWLISRGADVNAHDREDYSNLMWALRSTDEIGDSMHKVVWQMVRKGANVNWQDPTTGRTALMGAASLGDLDLVKELIRRGADRNKKTKGDWCISSKYDVQCTAMDYARLDGHVEVALYLEGKETSSYKQTLHYAARQADNNQVRRLIQSGADINEAEPRSGLTPLHYAVRARNAETVQLLLQAGAQPSPTDYAGLSPLREAIINYDRNIATLLIEAGARGDSKQLQGCATGMSEFGWAVSRGMFDIARLIIEKDAMDMDGGWLIFRQLDGRSEETVGLAEMVLKKGATPPEDYISLLQKWHSEYDFAFAPQIIALVKKYEEKPIIPMPSVLIPDNPDFGSDIPPRPEALKNLQIRSRSMNPDPELQKTIRKSQKFYDQKGRLSPDANIPAR